MVPGRVLEAPQVKYLEQSQRVKLLEDIGQIPKDNFLNSIWNIRNKEVHTTGPPAQLKVLKLGGEDLAADLQSAFLRASDRYHVTIDDPERDPLTVSYSSKDPLYEEALKIAFKELGEIARNTKKPGVLIVILPTDNANAIHARVKFLGDVKYGK